MCDENVKSICFLSLNGSVPSSVSSCQIYYDFRRIVVTFCWWNFDSFQMKFLILGVFAIIATCANAGVVQFLPGSSTTLVRTPSLDSAVVQSQQLNGGFSYRTVENHAYSPVVQTVSWQRNKVNLKLKLCNFWKRFQFCVSSRIIPKSLKSTTQDLFCPSILEFTHPSVVTLLLVGTPSLVVDILSLVEFQPPQELIHKIQLKLKIQQTTSPMKKSNKVTMKTLFQSIQHRFA